jgi:hypothetical protein
MANQHHRYADLASNDLRCNVGGLTGSGTAVRSIQAGQQFTFSTDVAVYHQGPVAVYISKANGDVTAYQGGDGWAKIAEIGPTFNGGSASWNLARELTLVIC